MGQIEQDRQLILDSRAKGPWATAKAYMRLSGPGWLQGATTLGGGSLSSSLYLGVLAGFSLLWLQPLAMIFGIIMLSGISYVTLSTGKRPFRAINEHVNPVLGWSWLIATMMANLVWSMPQFALSTAAIQQNLFKDSLGAIPDPLGKIIIGGGILAVCIAVILLYDSAGWGFKLFEILIKLMVGMVVICFFGVVIKLGSEGLLDWSLIRKGLIPDLSMLSSPAETFSPFLDAVDARYRAFWSGLIIHQQRDVMISAVATAVGINMTFLLPYSMLRKGWDRDFRSLAIFDLSIGLFIPFVLATGCVIIAAASQFHTVPAAGFLETQGQVVAPAKNLVGPYHKLLESRLKYETDPEVFSQWSKEEKAERAAELSHADKTLSAMLVKRDAFNLADALAPLTGKLFSQKIFGFGVLGMAVSTIIVLMLINGFVVCEMLNVPSRGWPHRIGCLIVSIGVLGPFFWNDAKLWLAIPTSVFGMVLLPIAYFTFCFLINQKELLGENMPRGGKRIAWNVSMGVSACFATFGSLWSLWSKLQWVGIGIFVSFTILVIVAAMMKSKKVSCEK